MFEPRDPDFEARVRASFAAQSAMKSLHIQLLSLQPGGVKMQLEKLIDDRLDEIGPYEVKIILKKMIDKHLGWLVLWGGVFGGVIGFTSTILLSKF